MSDFIDSLMERPASHLYGGWALILLLVVGGYFQVFYKAVATEHGELKEEVETLETQISHEQRLARDLPRVRREVKELDTKLKFAMAQLPDKREIPQLLASISDLATGAGLDVGLFKPKPDNFKEFYVEVPVSISVEGTFHQVVTFFDEVSQLDRIVNISNIAFREPKIKDGNVRIKSDCLATTFRFMDEEERAKRDSSKKGKKRRR
jgi:type IV pilus assembly protein PilO